MSPGRFHIGNAPILNAALYQTIQVIEGNRRPSLPLRH
jgi:hypothetical protein